MGMPDDSDDGSGRDWREWAYLRAEHWPEAIPEMGPKREYGPEPWWEITHENPGGVDQYPSSHPAAASCGAKYMGDVCPMCGVPLRWDEEVVLITGERGAFHEVDDIGHPTPAYHPECWRERVGEVEGARHMTLDAFAGRDKDDTEAEATE